MATANATHTNTRSIDQSKGSIFHLPRPTLRGVTLGTLQLALALVFLAHGAMLIAPSPEIAALMNAELPRRFWLFLGVAEVLACAGLTLPAVTNIGRWLMAWAAGGIVVTMVAATAWHLVRAEFSSAATTAVLLAVALVVTRVRGRQFPLGRN